MADPPARVGRVSDIEGAVSFLPPGNQDWVEVLRNFPITSGEAFWTGDGGRAELQLGGVQARLDYETELDVVALDYGQTRLSVPQGSVNIRLWRVPDGGVTIATPAGDVRLDQPGAYRLDVGAPDENGAYPPVEVTSLEGGPAEAPGVYGFVDVPPGAAAVIYAGYDPDLQDAQEAAIDDWARDREAQLRYARYDWQAETETGYQDLATYGRFESNPDYGQVWFPSDVPSDWAPYHYGQWSYVEPWGWTWVDDQPWGFAPFHYGRWIQIDGRWGWVRGQAVARPVYAPALVAFLGGAGIGIGVGLGAGGVLAWAPLAPNEPYIPPYRVSQSYVRQVNVTSVNQTVINNITVNNTTTVQAGQLRNASAAIAVPTSHLAGGAKIQQAAVHVTPQALAQASVTPAAAPPAPPPVASRPGAGATAGAPAGLRAAPPPPARLQQVRTAVAQAPPGSHAPPPIPGAHQVAQKPSAAPGMPPPAIAPAARQGREPPPKPPANRPAGPTPAARLQGMPPPAPPSGAAQGGQSRRVEPSPPPAPTEPGLGARAQRPPAEERPQVAHPAGPPVREAPAAPQPRRVEPNPPPAPPTAPHPRQANPPQAGPPPGEEGANVRGPQGRPPSAPPPPPQARPDQGRRTPPPPPQGVNPQAGAPRQPRPENNPPPPPNEKKKPPPAGPEAPR
jgi:hypothetical protein